MRFLSRGSEAYASPTSSLPVRSGGEMTFMNENNLPKRHCDPPLKKRKAVSYNTKRLLFG